MGHSDSWVLIDAGLRGSTSTIIDTAEERFGKGTPKQSSLLMVILITSCIPGIFDHWNVPVYAHRLASPDRSGRLPAADPSVGKGCWCSCPAYPNKAIDLGSRVQTLPEDESVPHMPGWRGFRSYPWACLAIPRAIAA